MAFQKTISLPSGVSGNYIRVTSYRWDRYAKECSATLSLYLDATHAQGGGEPLVAVIAKLRLSGWQFTEYLGALALAEHAAVAQIYAAARVEMLIAGGGITQISFADAQDV